MDIDILGDIQTVVLLLLHLRFIAILLNIEVNRNHLIKVISPVFQMYMSVMFIIIYNMLFNMLFIFHVYILGSLLLNVS